MLFVTCTNFSKFCSLQCTLFLFFCVYAQGNFNLIGNFHNGKSSFFLVYSVNYIFIGFCLFDNQAVNISSVPDMFVCVLSCVKHIPFGHVKLFFCQAGWQQVFWDHAMLYSSLGQIGWDLSFSISLTYTWKITSTGFFALQWWGGKRPEGTQGKTCLYLNYITFFSQ